MNSPMATGLKQNEKGEFYYEVDGRMHIVPSPVEMRFVGRFNPDSRKGEVHAHLERRNLDTGRWETI